MQPAVASVGDARDDWKIVRALSEVLGAPLPYNTLDDVRRRLADVAPHLARRDAVEAPLWLAGEQWKAAGDKKGAAEGAPLASGIANFYQTDAISRASKVGPPAQPVLSGLTALGRAGACARRPCAL